MNNTQNLITEFQQALNEEIEYIKEKGGGIKLIGRDGELEGRRGDYFIYLFLIDNPSDLPDDSPIEVRFGDEVTKGYVISLEGLKLRVVLEDDIGSRLPEVIITANPYYLLEILCDRLEEVKLDYVLAEKVFGIQNGKIADDYNFDTEFRLNKSQKRAVAKSLGSEISYIWGPPGTGKTHGLAVLAEILFSRGKSILIISHTNIAVDNAVEKIAPFVKDDPDFLSGRVLRYGQPNIKDLFSRFPEIDLNHWVELRSKELVEEQNRCGEELLHLKEILSSKEHLIKIYREIEQATASLDQDKVNLEVLNKKRAEHQAIIENLKAQIKDIEIKIGKAKEMGTLRRWFTGLSPEKLEVQKTSTIIRLKEQEKELKGFMELEFQTVRQKIFTDEKTLKNLKDEFKRLTDGTTLNISEEEHSIKELGEKISSVEKEIEEISTKLSQLEEEILREARLIATTLTKGYTKEGIFGRKFDVVIIDEASMAPMPALFFDCGLAKEKVVVIGDFRQLPPIAQADTPVVKKWLKRDIFEQAGITQTVDRKGEDDKLTQLVEQHRMHPNISVLVNDYIYDEGLIDIPKTGQEKTDEGKVVSALPFSGQPVILCDTSKFNPWCAITPSYSRFNIYQAELSFFLAKQALEQGVGKVGIITPYRAQASLLAKLVWDWDKDKKEEERLAKILDVSSVHRSQGREKDLIIFDLVEGFGAWVGKLLNGKFDSEAMKLINVAITRARSKLIIIGNFNYLLAKLNQNAVLRQILGYAINHYPKIDSTEIFDFIKEEEKEKTVESVTVENLDFGKKNIFYTQALFYKKFYEDLENHCYQELIIFSPFIGRQRVTDLEPYFRRLLAKGISVVIFTTPASKQKSLFEEDKEEILSFLKSLGITVILRGRMHEKLAIIDKNICWYGSLNILSHRNTTESMARFVGADTANELLRLFKVDFVQRQAIFKKRVANIKYGACPRCKTPMVVRKGKYGIFLSCPNYPRCESTMEIDENLIRQIYEKEFFVCEKCGSKMEIKRGRKGSRFLGCSKYPDCRFTRSF